MSILNAKKFLKAYLEQYEIEERLNNRLKTGMTRLERLKLLKEYERLGKRQNVLRHKISEEEFDDVLGDTLCMFYEDFMSGDFNETYFEI